MKKNDGKLKLGRETLRALEQGNLAPVAAGASDGVISCVCSDPKGCSGVTCTTHYC
jgi:hypothetical protein